MKKEKIGYICVDREEDKNCQERKGELVYKKEIVTGEQ